MRKYEKDVERFRNQFNPLKHAIECTLVFTITNLYNREGSINLQSKDLSNIEKCLLDITTGIRYMERGEVTLGIDDKHIVLLNSSKILGDNYNINLTFKIVDNKYTT